MACAWKLISSRQPQRFGKIRIERVACVSEPATSLLVRLKKVRDEAAHAILCSITINHSSKIHINGYLAVPMLRGSSMPVDFIIQDCCYEILKKPTLHKCR